MFVIEMNAHTVVGREGGAPDCGGPGSESQPGKGITNAKCADIGIDEPTYNKRNQFSHMTRILRWTET